MDGARRQFLARARRARNQDTGVRGRYAVYCLTKLIHHGRMPGYSARLYRARSKVADLPFQTGCFESAFGDEHEAIGFERLLDEVVSTSLNRGNGGFDVAVAGNHNDRQIGMLRLDEVQDLEPVEAATLQPYVKEDEVRPPSLDCPECFIRRAGSTCPVAFVLEDARH